MKILKLPERWPVVLAMAMLAVRLAMAAHLELLPDEAYYWIWSKHLALSYLDHPPMVAWFVWAGTAVGGDTELGVRLLGPFSVFATSMLVGASVRDFGGGSRGQMLGVLFVELMVWSSLVAIIMTPDTPLILFAALTLRLLAAIAAGGPNALWLAVGAAGGLALLSKYTAAATGLGILIWLLVVPSRRRLLAGPWPWAGAAVALAVFSPVIVWNITHHWASFIKQGGRTLEVFHLDFGDLGDFLGAQLLLPTPHVAIACAFGLTVLAREGLSVRRSDRGVLLPALALPLFFYLAVRSAGLEVQANWTLAMLPAAIAAAALVLGERWDTSGRVRSFVGWAAGVGLATITVIILYIVIPFDNGLGRRDITQRLSGHAEMTMEVDRIAHAQNLDTIAAFNYGEAAYMAFYGDPAIDVVQVTARIRYQDWAPPPRAAARLYHGSVLAVVDARDAGGLDKVFADFVQVGQVERKHRGVVINRYVLFRASGFKGQL